MVYEKGYFSLKIKKLGNWFKNMEGLKYDKSGNFCYGGWVWEMMYFLY